jgi:hypothetical protein
MAPEEVLYYSFIITLEILEKLWILFLAFLEERNQFVCHRCLAPLLSPLS